MSKFWCGAPTEREFGGKLLKKGHQKYSRENVEISLVVREPRQNFVKWSASRKRLITAVLTRAVEAVTV